eukprot:1243216-Karenia_brevis.AAC.1
MYQLVGGAHLPSRISANGDESLGEEHPPYADTATALVVLGAQHTHDAGNDSGAGALVAIEGVDGDVGGGMVCPYTVPERPAHT